MDLLFQLLSGTAAARDVAPDAWPALVETANVHGVAGLLAQHALQDTIPDDVRATLRALQEDIVQRNMRRFRDFALVAGALEGRGIPVIALKGMHLAPLIYQSLAARAMLDIDLLVPISALTAAGEAMRELGYEPYRPYHVSDSPTRPFYTHHVPPFLKSGASTVEVHWHVCDVISTVAVDVAELRERAVPARIGGIDTRVLAIEDLLLHLAVHATYSHRCEVSARACCDVAEIVRKRSIDWDALIERARRWNIGGGSYLVLRLSRELLGAPIPDDTLAALRPANFDERLLRIALRGEVDRSRVGRLRHAGGVRAKFQVLKELLFPRRDDLADAYAVPRSSPLVYGLYFRRAARLAGRWREVVAAHRDNSRVSEESAIIDNFLRGS